MATHYSSSNAFAAATSRHCSRKGRPRSAMNASSRFCAGWPGGTKGEIVVDLFDPRARDAPRLLRGRQNCQRIRDCLLDNPIDHVGHRDLPKTIPSERGSATAAPIP
jgi:hypothetical protein